MHDARLGCERRLGVIDMCQMPIDNRHSSVRDYSNLPAEVCCTFHSLQSYSDRVWFGSLLLSFFANNFIFLEAYLKFIFWNIWNVRLGERFTLWLHSHTPIKLNRKLKCFSENNKMEVCKILRLNYIKKLNNFEIFVFSIFLLEKKHSKCWPTSPGPSPATALPTFSRGGEWPCPKDTFTAHSLLLPFVLVSCLD